MTTIFRHFSKSNQASCIRTLSSLATKSSVIYNLCTTPRMAIDGNEATAHVAYALSDTCHIYPITPASSMGEYTDKWSNEGRKNIWGSNVSITELQSEGGAAGACHGSSVAGALTSSFTSSQGLLLMIPNIYKMVGEKLPIVLHVAARHIATQGLCIFCDHSDVMSCKGTGISILASGTVQEAMDMAAITHLASIRSSSPFIHFFDGFRTSAEINTIKPIEYSVLSELLDKQALKRHRARALNPQHPSLIGTLQPIDVVFQLLESGNPHHSQISDHIEQVMKEFSEVIGRKYQPFDYYGDTNADHIVVSMGSSSTTLKSAVDILRDQGKKVGVVVVRMFRPWSPRHLLSAVPKTVSSITVLDRYKEPGSPGEALYEDISFTVDKNRSSFSKDVNVLGGRYGLGGKDFTVDMALGVFKNMNNSQPKNDFSVGIEDDVTHKSIPVDYDRKEKLADDIREALFWGMGGDGTVSANHQAIRILVGNTPLFGQAYFEYSAHKSGGVTRSHLRFGKDHFDASYPIQNANYIACHKTPYIQTFGTKIIDKIKEGGTFVLNCPWNDVESLNKHLPSSVKRMLAERKVKLYTINATEVAEEVGLKGRINMIMQAVFFHLSGVIPSKEALELLKEELAKEYSTKGADVIAANCKAVDTSLSKLNKIEYTDDWLKSTDDVIETIEDEVPKFIREIQIPFANLEGNNLPVSVFEYGGIIPSGTSKYEKRGVSTSVPIWDHEKCTQCNNCSIICSHGSIRPFIVDKKVDIDLNDNFVTAKLRGGKGKTKDLEYRMQVSPLDCVGCELCVQVCPDNALTMKPLEDVKDNETMNWNQSIKLPNRVHLLPKRDQTSTKGTQFNTPLLEFSGACAGCTESAMVKMITQLFGKQTMIANATGCSSVWSGSYPICPFTPDPVTGEGPAWGNSLFEDNAEYGFGMHIGTEQRRKTLHTQITNFLSSPTASEMNNELKEQLEAWLEKCDNKEESYNLTHKITSLLKQECEKLDIPFECCESACIHSGNCGEYFQFLNLLKESRDILPKQSQWIIGGDGWAYDIGYGGLDHVLASNADVNVLVMDTEAYSNTGGQSSKATPLAAVQKFASLGKSTPKKDLGAIAMTYQNIYVASVCIGADMDHYIKVLKEAESYPGPSLIIGYATCIEHGIKGGIRNAIDHARNAVDSGYWLLYRYDPRLLLKGKNPLQVDSKPNLKKIPEFLDTEARFAGLTIKNKEIAMKKQKELCEKYTRRYDWYKKMADLGINES